MKKFILICVAMVFCLMAHAGIILTVENDALFDQSDDNYSHGTEIEYVTWKYDTFVPYRVGYGISQLMFTPQNISDPNMPPMTDRPWAGTLNFYYETWERTPKEEINTRYSIGAMGSFSGAEQSQKEVHRWLDCNAPMGWDNQMPDEPMLNIYQDRYRLILKQKLFNELSTDLKFVYGGTVGTTYLNARGGVQARIGYNIPENSLPGSIVPKTTRDGQLVFANQRFFIYCVGGIQEMYAPFNSTIGGSIFQNRKAGQERPLEEFVYSYRYGFVGGIKNMSVTYIWEERQEEFEGETDGGLGFGMLRLEFTYQF